MRAGEDFNLSIDNKKMENLFSETKRKERKIYGEIIIEVWLED